MVELTGIEQLAAAQRSARNGATPALADVTPCTATAAIEVFQRRLYLPDPSIVYAVLGAIAANRLDGERVWLLTVAPPSGGKTEVLQATAGLPDVHPTADLTMPSLLSGSSKKDRGKNATGGLLRVIGDSGVILCKDFGSVLSMHRDKRAEVLGALREIYDGSWTRHVGVDGGQTLHWAGQVGFIGGCTPVIDTAHAVMAAMGERFLLFRPPVPDGREQVRSAVGRKRLTSEMRAELAHAVAGVFAVPPIAPELPDSEIDNIAALACLVVQARSSVIRDGYSREIELVPGAEAPARIGQVLGQMFSGLQALGLDRDTAWWLVAKIGMDCIPALRRQALELLADSGEITTADVATWLKHPTTTVRRALEDLNAYGVVHRIKGNRDDSWQIVVEIRDDYRTIVPEMSSNPFNDRSRNVR